VFSGKVCVVIGSLAVPLFIFSVLRIPKKEKRKKEREMGLIFVLGVSCSFLFQWYAVTSFVSRLASLAWSRTSTVPPLNDYSACFLI
jgi:hypothetical protein